MINIILMGESLPYYEWKGESKKILRELKLQKIINYK